MSEALAARLVAAGRVRDGRVAAAFRAVPREVFLPGVPVERVYADVAVPTKWDAAGKPVSSSSQPSIMAEMLGQLGVGPGHRVLEIGAGTGYNAALLAHLAGPAGRVTTVDIDPDTAAAAAAHLRAAGLDVVTTGPAAGPDAAPGGVTVVEGDGAAGWPAGAPYDRVILTAAAPDLAPAWTAQLAPGGRIVLPLALRGVQHSVAFERDADGLASVSVVACGFMPLRGGLAGADTARAVPGEPGVFLDAAAAPEPLPAPYGDPVPAGAATPAEVLGGLRLWLALHEPAAGTLLAVGRRPPVPAVADEGGLALTPVLPAPGGLAVVVPAGPGRIAVQAYGEPAPTGRLLARIADWHAAGRPGPAGLRIRARPPAPRPPWPWTRPAPPSSSTGVRPGRSPGWAGASARSRPGAGRGGGRSPRSGPGRAGRR